MKWLTADGAVASLAVGVAVTVGLGLPGLALLFVFFLSGSLLTQISGGTGGRRNARQVIANGGAAAVAALFGSWYGAAGAIAAATADTWATEVGSFSRTPPRMLTSGAPVPAGTSGGVTWLGTAGAVAGAVLIAALGALLSRGSVAFALITLLAGVAGMFGDSLLGATVQARSWLDNDGVNLVATTLGSLVGLMGSRIG